jgi:hypothetical protein
MAKQTFKVHSHAKLAAFMKKFSSIEKSLLFELDGDKVVAKTHTPDKSVVKIGSTLISDIMDPIGDTENVKVGLFVVDNFISAFKHFGEAETKIEINGEKVGSDTVATEMKASSKNLKISFPCASMSLFRYIDSELAKKICDVSSASFSFRIDKDTLSRISSLASLDSDSDILTISAEGGNVSFKGKTFQYSLEGVTVENDGIISFFKSHLSFIDREDSEIFVTDGKTIVKSLESDTVMAIGKVE